MATRNGKISRRQICNHTATTSSNPSIQDLEENMLIEILSRVPTAASAICLKLVCKRWCSLISTPYFIKTFVDKHNRYQDSHSYQKPFGFLLPHVHAHGHRPKCAGAMFSRNSVFDFQDFSLSRNLPEKKKHDIIVLASCNDLIMFVLGNSGKNRSYFLCNPFTKQWVALPSPPLVTRTFYPISNYGLVCEPYCCGENVMNSLCRYRIVHFCYSCKYEPGNLMAVETYYSETGQWAESDPLGEADQHIMASKIAAYKGKLCWIDGGRRFLVTYDPFNMGHRGRIHLADDISLYQASHRNKEKLRIGVSDGVLRIIRLENVDEVRSHSRPCYTVWDLEEVVVGGEWWLRMRLKHEVEDGDSFCNEAAMHPRNKDVVYFYTRKGGIYREFNMESRKFEAGGTLNSQGKRCCSYYDSQYKIFPVELPWWPTPLLDRSSATLLASEGQEQSNKI